MTKRKAKIEFKKTKAGGQKGAWRYAVKGNNGEILATSEGYTTKQNAEKGLVALALVMMDFAFAEVQNAIRRSR